MHVAVAVPTFRRPAQLRKLLETLAAQEGAPRLTILVADNDAAGAEGLGVAATMVAGGYPHAIDAFPVAAPGLCHARNALVARALADGSVTHVAMLDDDQWVPPGWMRTLAAAHVRTGADVTGAPVRYHFDGPTPAWHRSLIIFASERRAEGPAAMLYNLGSSLSNRAAWEELPAPWFDLRLNEIGGEDLDLYTRWAAAGVRFAWTTETEAHESVPPARAELGWAWRRLWRIGNTDTLVAWNHAGTMRRLILIARTAAMTAGSLLLWPFALPVTDLRIRATGRVIRQFGRIAGLTGYGFREYRH